MQEEIDKAEAFLLKTSSASNIVVNKWNHLLALRILPKLLLLSGIKINDKTSFFIADAG